MMKLMLQKTILAFLLILALTPQTILARVNPEDIYQQSRTDFASNLAKISDPVKKQQVSQADQLLQKINLDICHGFDYDIAKMAAILDEEKARQKINSTRVAYGLGSTPMDDAEYYVNFAEEAVAYQKVQNYTPQIGGGNQSGGVQNSLVNLIANLNTAQEKVLKAKTEVQTALNYYEK